MSNYQINMQVAAQISDIKRLVWQQNWKEALARCQDLLDDPQVDEAARREAQTLRQDIETKARAEATILQTLDAADQELKKASPDYGTLLTQLNRALELGNVHYIQRWHNKIQAKSDEVHRRRDLRVRFETDHTAFKEALEAGNYEKAMEIAQRLLDDAEMSQQPALADSAREWLKQVSAKVKHDQIAASIMSALERDDFAWACALFAQLPPTHPRYDELAPLVDDAQIRLEQIRQDLEMAEARWQAGKPTEAEVVLGNLRRQFKKNRLWKPLWLQFYSEQADQANAQGDEMAARGLFLEAGQAYRKAEMAFHKLRDEFEDDPGLQQSADTARARVTVCGFLAEAVSARERLSLVEARAAGKKAIGELDKATPFVRETTHILRQRAVQLVESLDLMEHVVEDLKAAENAPPDSDTRQVLRDLDHVLACPDLPESARRKAEALRVKTKERENKVQAVLQEARVAKATAPEQAAEVYDKAWQLSHSVDLQKEIVEFMLEKALQEANVDEKRGWLERAQRIDPKDEKVASELALFSLQPEFDKDFLPLRARLDNLERQPAPSAADLEAVKVGLDALAEKVKSAKELKALVEPEQARYAQLCDALAWTQARINEANEKTQGGLWAEAIRLLQAAAGQASLDSQRQKLLGLAESMKAAWDEASMSYKEASTLYNDALKAKQSAPQTRDYALAGQKAKRARESLEQAISKVEGLPPLGWTKLKQELGAFERLAGLLQRVWEASLDPRQPLAELVKELRAQEASKTDPVVANLLAELTKRAVTECLAKADEAEEAGNNEDAARFLADALSIGGEQAGLRARLEAISKRSERNQRLEALRNEIRTCTNLSGKLPEAAKKQTEVLILTAEDVGEPAWVEAVQRVIQTIPPEVEQSLQRIVQEAQDAGIEADMQQMTKARVAYGQAVREAERAVEQLHRTMEGAGLKKLTVLSEADRWLHFNQQLVLYNMATSVAALGDFVRATKDFKRLQDLAQPGEYDFAREYLDVRNSMLGQVQTSATKRLNEAQTALEGGFYDQAIESLKDIENFYAPVERDFPDLRGRLNEAGTELGDLRQSARRNLLEAQRLQEVAQKLGGVEARMKSDWNAAREAESEAEAARDAARKPGADRQETERKLQEARSKFQRKLDEALNCIQEGELQDPGRECTRIWKRLDRLAEQIRGYRKEREAEAARRIIRAAEADIPGAHEEEDYQTIKARLQDVNPDVLDSDYQARYKNNLAMVAEQAKVPALLRLADQELEREHYDYALDYYKQAVDIRPALGRNPEFMQKHNRARRYVEDEAAVQSLVDKAPKIMPEDPQTALRLLEEARDKAEQLGLSTQVQNIQRMIQRAKAQGALNEARKAMGERALALAKRRAMLAKTLAEPCNEAAIKTEADQILKEIEDIGKILHEVVGKARTLLRDRKWKQALDLLSQLPPEDPLAQQERTEAEEGYQRAEKAEGEIKTLLEAGQFADAFSRLNKARINLDISEEDADRLRQDIQQVEDRMRGWNDRLQALVHRLASAEVVKSADIEDAITELRGLSEDPQAVKGLRDEASQLARNLGNLKQQLQTMNRTIDRASQLAEDCSTVLRILVNIPEAFPVQYQGQTFLIKHGAADAVRQMRRQAISKQLAAWKSQCESLSDYTIKALQEQIKACQLFANYLSDENDRSQLDEIRADIEEIIAKKQTEQLCQRWGEQLVEAERLRDAGEVDKALTTAQAIQKQAEEQKKESPAYTWPGINEVWQRAVRLKNEIENKEVSEALNEARAALESGSIDRVSESELGCNRLLQSPAIGRTSKARIGEMARQLADTKVTLQNAENVLAQAKNQIRLRQYGQALGTLVTLHPCPESLRPWWETLTKVVSEFDRADRLIAGAGDIVAPDSLSIRLGTYKDALQGCRALQKKWPAELPATEAWIRDLHSETELLIRRLCRVLGETTGRMVNLALASSKPDDAARLITTARDSEQGWVTADEEERVKDMEHEVTIVRAMLVVESALMSAGSDLEGAASKLKTLYDEPRTINEVRRQKALGLLTLVDVCRSLERGDIAWAEQLMGDPALATLTPYAAVSSRVATAAKDRAIVRGLIDQADKLLYAPSGADFGDASAWLSWLPEIKKRASDGQPVCKSKLLALQKRVGQEVRAAREEGNYARLRKANPLAQALDVGEPDVSGLETERKGRLRQALEQVRQSLSAYAPESASAHLEMARRLCEQDRAEVSVLEKDWEEIRQRCQEADKLISDADVYVTRNDYTSAANNYQGALQRAPKRSTVMAFEKTQHEILWRAFQEAADRDEFPQALEIVDNALRFGFKAGDWQMARRDLESRRDKQIAELIARVGGLLGTADPDLDQMKQDLQKALVWKPDSAELRSLEEEVNRRLKAVGEMRLAAKQGWVALDQGDYTSAWQYFSAQTGLRQEHPEMVRWLRFTNMIHDADQYLVRMSIDAEPRLTGGFQVKCPTWNETEELLAGAATVLVAGKSTILLGEEGESNRTKYIENANRWYRIAQGISQELNAIQRSYDAERWEEAKEHYYQANEYLRTLKQDLRGIAVSVPIPGVEVQPAQELPQAIVVPESAQPQVPVQELEEVHPASDIGIPPVAPVEPAERTAFTEGGPGVYQPAQPEESSGAIQPSALVEEPVLTPQKSTPVVEPRGPMISEAAESSQTATQEVPRIVPEFIAPEQEVQPTESSSLQVRPTEKDMEGFI